MFFQEQVVIITGGGTGIGKAAARNFLAEGAKVVDTTVDRYIDTILPQRNNGRSLNQSKKESIREVL